MSSADPRLRALLKLAPVIPVYTPEDVNEAVEVAQALFRGGLPVIEVTLRTPQALDAIKAMVEAVPDAVIGAGTVLNAAQMQAAKQAGARFAVSPGATPALYAAARDADLPYLPGAATASDLIQGLEHGADTFKFFPAVQAGGAALLAACFSLPGGVLRAIGGALSDRYGAHSVTWWVLWVCWVCLFLLSYPQTDFTVLATDGPRSFHIGLNVYAFTGLMFVLGIAMAFGKASVFKYISDDYPANIGAISGIVGLAGGLGGFVLPILFGVLLDWTGVRSSAFMLMYGVVWVSLAWMYFTEVRRTDVMDAPGARAAGTAR